MVGMRRKYTVQLGAQEYEVLRAIAKSPSFPLSSTQRLRFEMLGLIEDRANGIWLTENDLTVRGAEAAADWCDKALGAKAAA